MAEFRYVDLPEERAEAKRVPLAVSAELNQLVAEGWEPVEMMPSRVVNKVGFLLRR